MVLVQKVWGRPILFAGKLRYHFLNLVDQLPSYGPMSTDISPSQPHRQVVPLARKVTAGTTETSDHGKSQGPSEFAYERMEVRKSLCSFKSKL